jgi:spoIIIJ-associated protein
MNGSDSIAEAMDVAKQYLENLLSFFGINTTVEATNDEAVIQLNVPNTTSNAFLIGQHGDTMRALQFITSNTLKNGGYSNNRVNVDVADYKKQRADRLREKAVAWVTQVKDNGQLIDLEPMNAADRRVIHQLAAEHGIISESAGDGRERHIVLKPNV